MESESKPESTQMSNEKGATRRTLWAYLTLYGTVYFVQAIVSVFIFSHFTTLYTGLMFSQSIIALLVFSSYLPLTLKPVISRWIKTLEESTVKKIFLGVTVLLLLVGVVLGFGIGFSSWALVLAGVSFLMLGFAYLDVIVDAILLGRYREKSTTLSWIQIAASNVGSIISVSILSWFIISSTTVIEEWIPIAGILGILAVLLLPWLFTISFKIPKDLNQKTHLTFKVAVSQLTPQERKRVILMSLFLIGIHGSYLVGTLIEQLMVENFETSGYIEYTTALNSIGSIINLVLLILSIFLLPWLKRHGIKIIIIAGTYAAVYLFLFPWLELATIKYMAIIYSPLGFLYGIVWISLLIQYVPKTNVAWWYQMFTVVVLLSRMILDPLGALLLPLLGYPVIFGISALILILNIPILLAMNRNKDIE
ncbi:MAG: hypothetical protein ACTSRK_00290 [Promethearchaeota archaeon]